MAIYDILMLIVFAGAIWFGYWKGLAWQIASLAAIIVSYIVAANFHDVVSGFIKVQPPWNQIGAMLVLFIGTSLVIWTVYASISKSLKKNELKGFDRQIGALLGAAKGFLLCMVITMFATTYSERAHVAVHENSKLGPYIENAIWKASSFVPEEIAHFVDPHVKNWKEAVGHRENEVDPNQDLNNVLDNVQNMIGGGNTYQTQDQTYNQTANQIPQNQTGYQGQWQTPNTNVQYGTNYGNQAQNSQQNTQQNWPNSGGTQTAQNTISELDVSKVAKELMEAARAQGLEYGWEAIKSEARRRLNEAAQQQR